MSAIASRNSGRYLILILSFVSILNYIDRQIFTILLQSVKNDLAVSDMAMGLLSGTTFAVFYAVSSIPVARWADRGVRRSILAGALAIWSGLTATCGFAHTFLQLAVARAGVAVAESAAMPVSQSLAADMFPREKRATVFGVLMAAGSGGIGLGLFIGGWANEHFGWRAAFMIVGVPGLLTALLLRLTVAEPARTEDPTAPGATIGVAGLLADPLYRWLLVLTGLGSFVMYGMLGWAPTFMIRVHGVTTSQVGLLMGISTAVSGVLGHYLTGYISDHLARRDVRWYARFPAIGALVTLPFAFWFLLASNPYVAILMFTVQMFFMASWLMPSYAIAYRIVSANSRTLASAMIAATMSLVGLGLGPLLIGAANDWLTPSYHQVAVRYSLLGLVSLNVILALGFLRIVPMLKALDASPGMSARPIGAADSVAAESPF